MYQVRVLYAKFYGTVVFTHYYRPVTPAKGWSVEGLRLALNLHASSTAKCTLKNDSHVLSVGGVFHSPLAAPACTLTRREPFRNRSHSRNHVRLRTVGSGQSALLEHVREAK